MKKKINRILIIALIIMIGMSFILITKVNAASSVGVSVSSATEGGTFSVSLILPETLNNTAVHGASCKIQVVYSDGSSTTTGTGGETGIAYIKGGEAMGAVNSISFKAKVAGTTKIYLTNIVIADINGKPLEQSGTKEEVFTIKAKESSNSGNSGTANNGNNSSSSNSTSTNTTTNNQGGDSTNTTKEPEVVNPTFKDVNETVYAISGCNVRSSCSSSISSNKIGGLKEGQSVTRTGYHGEWSRITYNGKTAYVATRLLTTEEPKEEENTVANKVENTAVKNEVTNKVENNTIENNTIENEVGNNTVDQNGILGNLQNEIGVLPEVGRNIADYMFMFVSFIAISIVMIINYKSKNKSL